MDTRGIVYTVCSFLLWGLVPIYWKLLKGIPPFEIVNHRIIWTAIVLNLFLLFRNKSQELTDVFRDRKKLGSLLLSTVLISSNWFIFVWAVNSNHVLETSMGYYINPLLNIILGATILKEQFSTLKKISVTFAFIGVVYLTLQSATFPWIALSLAGTFGLYGFVRKIIQVKSDIGLTAESTLLFPLALVYLAIIPENHFTSSLSVGTLLFFGGFVTTIPLLLYLEGVRRIPYSTVGILQFITPTTTFFMAIFLYHEPLKTNQLISFIFIWIAVAIYIVDLVRIKRASRLVRPIPN